MFSRAAAHTPCGRAGVELAAVVAERLRGRARIKLITSTDDILPQSPQVLTFEF